MYIIKGGKKANLKALEMKRRGQMGRCQVSTSTHRRSTSGEEEETKSFLLEVLTSVFKGCSLWSD